MKYKQRRDEDIIKVLGKNIRKYRKAKGLTQTQFAKLFEGDMYSQISRMERGTVNSTITLINCVAQVLEVRASDLLQKD